MAASGSMTTGSGSYSTLTSSAASSATARDEATTAATHSPAYRASSTASGNHRTSGTGRYCRSGSVCAASSDPVSTAVTPSSSSAALASMPVILACA